MAARDDSVIRGSLITSLIVLVLSLALNFFLYRWGSTSSLESARAREQLANSQNEVRSSSERITLMKAMMGVGSVSEAEFELLRNSASGDPEMEQIERQFVEDMAYFGPDVDSQNRNYPALPEYLVNAIRSRNEQYSQAREEATSIRVQAASDVDNARKAEAQANQSRDQALTKLESETELFNEDREKMKLEGAKMQDTVTKLDRDFRSFRDTASKKEEQLTSNIAKLETTVTSQRQELNRLRSDRFENVQGEITYVVPPGRLVHLNLGSADSLRVGVQFGVVDVNELNVEEADLKAEIQVTKILGEHSAQARVLGNPSYRNPLVEGDKLYSPFWAPGRKVKIALAGDIDLTGDGRSDIRQLKSMIELAGAEVAAMLSPTGELEGTLDSSIRFLVVGEQPVSESAFGVIDDETRIQAINEIGRFKAQATELGITPIPAWKLMEYLKGISDAVTIPLGSDRRPDDFNPPEISSSSSRSKTTLLPEIYRNQVEGQPER